jgi:hypothetical protein
MFKISLYRAENTLVFITNTDMLMMFKEMITVCFERRTNLIDTRF